MDCVEKLIKKDMLDPINSARLKDSDIIPLQRVKFGSDSILIFAWLCMDTRFRVDAHQMIKL